MWSKSNIVCKKRASGVLAHISSLPSAYGIGDLGPAAYAFCDFLSKAKQSLWQVLPLNPTIAACGHSPYSSISAFAGNTLFISPELLRQEHLLAERDMSEKPDFSPDSCDYRSVLAYKEKLLQRAYEHFRASTKLKDECEYFCNEEANWLEDYALFKAIRDAYDRKPWNTWDVSLRDWQPQALRQAKRQWAVAIEKEKFLQFIFYRQWFALKKYCNQKGIFLIGDIPIYVNLDSADVWSNSNIFKLDENKQPTHVAGVPPDYFSASGQLWGNPVYCWDKMRKLGYKWWIKRLGHNLKCFDYVRIDHFRGLVAYWEVRYGESTAVNGYWRKAPVKDFFRRLFKHFGELPIIAEDLGIITEEVRATLKSLGFPGMKVLQFAFGEDNPHHPYLPHNFKECCLVYTGTHDNNTSRGWFEREADESQRRRLARYAGRAVSAEDVHVVLMRLAMSSVARIAVFPLQDILGLGESARMNVPSSPRGNWVWRVRSEQLSDEIAFFLGDMTDIYGRAS